MNWKESLLAWFLSTVLTVGLLMSWFSLTLIPGYFEVHAGGLGWVIGFVVALALIIPMIYLSVFVAAVIWSMWWD
jgi:hypothetical protein